MIGTSKPVRVKICGHTSETDVRGSVAAGADAIGVISEVPVDTPRAVAIDRAVELVATVPALVTSVLVTMPDSVEETLSLVDRVRPDAVQIHGGLTDEEIESVGECIDRTLLVAVDAADRERVRRLDSIADALVLDSTDEHGAGGTGQTHDWECASSLVDSLSSPVLLAGGLSPSNVAEAVDVVDPFGVDVASGVESEGGIKDPDAVRRFVTNATRAGETRGDGGSGDELEDGTTGMPCHTELPCHELGVEP